MYYQGVAICLFVQGNVKAEAGVALPRYSPAMCSHNSSHILTCQLRSVWNQRNRYPVNASENSFYQIVKNIKIGYVCLPRLLN